jgi:hypothetical protein
VKTTAFLALARTAERFNQRPSVMLGVNDPVAMLEIDLAAWGALAEQDRRVVEKIKRGGGESPYEESSYEDGAGSWLKPQTVRLPRRPGGEGGEGNVK